MLSALASGILAVPWSSLRADPSRVAVKIEPISLPTS